MKRVLADKTNQGTPRKSPKVDRKATPSKVIQYYNCFMMLNFFFVKALPESSFAGKGVSAIADDKENAYNGKVANLENGTKTKTKRGNKYAYLLQYEKGSTPIALRVRNRTRAAASVARSLRLQ
jgi:hypothetical protein